MEKEKLDIEEHKMFLEKAYKGLSNLESDSIKKSMLLDISYQYFQLGDSMNFRKTNSEARELSMMFNDSNSIALTYWDLAGFYHARNIEDSAYYYYNKAQKIYVALANRELSARVLLNMAIIQKNIKDYTGSEVSTIQAISLLEPLKKYKYLYRAYNNLGIIYKELDEYDKSLSFYKTAEEYIKKADRMELLPSLWNNIGVLHKKNKQYNKAELYFDKAIQYGNQLHRTDPELYAMLLDNRTHNRFQSGDTTEILSQYKKALAVRKKENIIPGIIISKLHLAEYFLKAENDTIAAYQNAFEAKDLAIKSLNGRDMLVSLQFLSKIAKDSSIHYLHKYIHTNDSLERRERLTRNKFARIRYETAGYIAETERLSERIFKISIIGITATLILILLVIIQRQRSRNKELLLIQEKQKKFEEGREKEKRRISRELHDGVLAKLFGVTMSLDILNEENDTETKKKRHQNIQEIKKISEEIRLLSHELSEISLTTTDYTHLLKEFIEQQNQNETKFKLKIDPSIKWETIENNIKINLFRVVQETTQNTHKHALATKCTISFTRGKKELILVIKDNGKGFVQGKTTLGIGLKNIGARVKNLNGSLKIISDVKGKGTQIIIRIPISSKGKPWKKTT